MIQLGILVQLSCAHLGIWEYTRGSRAAAYPRQCNALVTTIGSKNKSIGLFPFDQSVSKQIFEETINVIDAGGDRVKL